MSLEASLPAELRSPSTTFTKIAAGLSGAGVYRVEAEGQAFVLKLSGDDEPLEAWRRKLHIQQLAASAGLAPRVVHADEARRAVVSAFVVDRSFVAFYWNPHTREAALSQLGRTLRHLHELPLPPGAEEADPRATLAELWAGPLAGFAVPTFVSDAVRRVLTEEAPARERALVLSHNDVNPTNLVYDGEKLLLLDWEAAGANDPFFDLAASAVFLRMDEPSCLRLLAAHDNAPVAALPPRFVHLRRVVATLCGSVFLRMARASGHPGATDGEALPLGEFYQRMRAGLLNPATAEGKWAFGLALMREGAAV